MNTPFGKAPLKKQKRSGKRHSHSIRFSDSEWRLVEQACVVAWHSGRGVRLVRERSRRRRGNLLQDSPESNLSVGHAALIEAIYRAVYLLATINREQLIEAGRRGDIDRIVAEARDAMAQVMNETQDG